MTFAHARGYRSKRSRGFSLIEAMIAFLIIGIGFLGISKLQLFVSTGSGSSQQRTQALHMAQDKIECFRAWPSSCAGSYAAITAGTDAAITHNGAVFRRSWTVNDHSDPTYKGITVQVLWSNREGDIDDEDPDPSRQVTLLTKISDIPSVGTAGSTTSGSATSTSSTATNVSTTTTSSVQTTTTTAAPTTAATTTTTAPICLPKNADCSSDGQCCSKNCQSSSGKCKD